MYGGLWLKDFPDMDSIENWKEAWAEALLEDRVTPHEVAEGLRTCRRVYPEWPPSVGEFLHVCRPGLIPENAFYDAVAGMAARRRGEIGTWAHVAVYWAAVAVGTHDLLNCGYSVMKSRWERALAEELARGEWRSIPEPAVALPSPGTAQATPEQAAQALKAMGASAIPNDSGRDPRRWAKRILAAVGKGDTRYSPTVVSMVQAAMNAYPDQGGQA